MDKKTRNYLYRYTFIISLALGVTVWILDAVFDYLFFYQGHSSFLSLLITEVPPHELYIRISALILFACFGILFSFYLKKYVESDTRLTNIFNNVIPICITDNDSTIISANKSYKEIFGPVKKENSFIKCYESRPGPKCKTSECPLQKITKENKQLYTCESTKNEPDGSKRFFIVTATPYKDLDDKPIGIIETFQDISERRLLENEREQLITDLKEAMKKVKTLSGFLPICASCKKIRDDKGYWKQIESYIKDHSDAEFSHSICPDCAENLYGNYLKEEDNQTE